MPEFICDHCGASFQADPNENGTVVCSTCGGALSAESANMPLPAGTKVAGFEIIRYLASGGVGNVYVAEQLSMERSVALKILNPNLIDETNAKRFLEEARNTAKFQNPHVVSVIDAGVSEEGLYYIAMQYVEGETLEALLERGRTFTEDEALMTAITVAEALKTIWNKAQMFHKDIKPGNIMLTPDNDPMILDMGIAQSRGASVLINGQVEGSPYYMSPEQARGDVLSWSTDLYSLGTTVYQMVTGVFPYDAPTVEGILLKHNSAPFPEPETRSPNVYVSPQLTALLRRMMGKTPAERFASWEEFIDAARHILTCYWELNGSPVSKTRRHMILGTASSPSLPPHVVRRPSSTIRFAFFGMIIFLLAAALTGGTFLYLAAKKNSSNASAYLHPVRKMLSAARPDVAAIESYMKKSEKYFDKFGVAPSVKREFTELKKHLEEYKSTSRQEESVINALDTFVANKLQESDEEITLGKKALEEANVHQTKAHYLAAAKRLQEAKDKIDATPFKLQANTKRASVLRQRVNVAAETVNRTLKHSNAPKVKRPGPAPSAKEQPDEAGKTAEPVPSSSSEKTKAVPSGKSSDLPSQKEEEQKRIAGIQVRYNKFLADEKNRIRILLILEDTQRKFAAKNSIFTPSAQKNDAPVLKALNDEHQKWLDSMEDIAKQAGEVWNMLYDSRKTFAGYPFTVPKTGTKMLLGTIIRDMAVLHYQDMPNEKILFSQLHPLEWKAFVKYAAGKKEKKNLLVPYFFLSADFVEVKNTKNPFIIEELPKLRETYYRFLAGENFPGVDEKLRLAPEEALRRHGGNPAFAPYKEKILKMIRTQNQTTPKGKK